MPSPREKASKQARKKTARKRESIISTIPDNLNQVQDTTGNIFQFLGSSQAALDTVVPDAKKRCNLTDTTLSCSNPNLIFDTDPDGCNFEPYPAARKNASLAAIPINSRITLFSCGNNANNTRPTTDCIKSSILADCDGRDLSKLAAILLATIPTSLVILVACCMLYNYKRGKQDAMRQPLNPKNSGVNANDDESKSNRCRC